MKKEKDLESLLKKFENKEPLMVSIDGDEFELFKYNPEKNMYQGEFGCIHMENMLRAIKDKNYFIQVGEV